MFRQYTKLSRTVHLLCLGALINRAGSFLVPFLALYLRDKLDLSAEFAATSMGVFGLGSIIASNVGGHLADRFGRRVVMVTSLLGSATILLMFGSLTSPSSVLAGILIFAVVSDSFRPAAQAMIADVTDPTQRPQAFALMYIAINLGFAIAASAGGIIAKHYSFNLLFIADALTTASFALVIALGIKETMPKPEAQGETADSQDASTDQISWRNAVQYIVRDKAFVLYWMGTFFLSCTYMQAMTTFPLYLDAQGFGSDTYGNLIAINGFLIVVMQLPTTSLIGRFDRGKIVVVSAVVTAIGFRLIGPSIVVWQYALTIVIWTVGEMMNAPSISAIISDLAPVRLRARYMGAFSMCFSMAMMISTPIGGVVLERLGGGILWAFAGLLGVSAAVSYYVAGNYARSTNRFAHSITEPATAELADSGVSLPGDAS